IKIKKILFFRKDIFVSITKFVGPLVFITILAASSSWILGRLILKDYGEHTFAAYSIGLQWFALALFIPGMISRVVLPRLIREEKNQKETLKIACLAA